MGTRAAEPEQESLAQQAQQVAEQVSSFAQEHPHAALAAAFGIGWILANGVPPRWVQFALAAGAKRALRSAVTGEGLLRLAEEISGRMGAPPAHSARSAARRAGQAGA